MRRAHTLVLLALITAPALAAAGLASPLPSAGSDWPQFRGPERDGHSRETGLLPAPGPWTERFRVPLGSGYSSVSVVGDAAVTMFGKDGGEYLGAFSASSGEELWRLRLGDLYRDGQGDGPRSTPTIADGTVFAFGAQGALVAVDLESGRPNWRHDLRNDYGARVPTWGFSSSPLLVDSTLLVEVGGRDAAIVAFDRATGAEVWRALDDAPGYAAPILIEMHGLRQAVFFTAGRLVGIPAAGGAALWSVPWKTSYDVNAATPIFVPPDRILVASGYGVGGALVQVPAAGAEEGVATLWRSTSLKNQFSSSVIVGDAVYGFDNSMLVCLDLATGERLWRERGFGHGSLIAADGHLIILGERGTLAVARATPGEYQEIHRQEIFTGKAWTPPSLARGTLFLRDENELVALEIRSTD
jgi:outer membrane protein assembly factor BamB